MECREIENLFDDYLDGELDAAGRERVEQHLAGCANCRAGLEELRHTVALVGSLPRVDAPAGLARGVSVEIARRAELRRKDVRLRWAAIGGWVAAAAMLLLVLRYAPWEQRGHAPEPPSIAMVNKADRSAGRAAASPQTTKDEAMDKLADAERKLSAEQTRPAEAMKKLEMPAEPAAAPDAGAREEALAAEFGKQDEAKGAADSAFTLDAEGEKSRGEMREAAAQAGAQPGAPAAAGTGGWNAALAAKGAGAAQEAPGNLEQVVLTYECKDVAAGRTEVLAALGRVAGARIAPPTDRAQAAADTVVVTLPVDRLADLARHLMSPERDKGVEKESGNQAGGGKRFDRGQPAQPAPLGAATQAEAGAAQARAAAPEPKTSPQITVTIRLKTN